MKLKVVLTLLVLHSATACTLSSGEGTSVSDITLASGSSTITSAAESSASLSVPGTTIGQRQETSSTTALTVSTALPSDVVGEVVRVACEYPLVPLGASDAEAACWTGLAAPGARHSVGLSNGQAIYRWEISQEHPDRPGLIVVVADHETVEVATGQLDFHEVMASFDTVASPGRLVISNSEGTIVTLSLRSS